MKRSIKLAVVAALALGSTSAFATNGDVMIGQGAKSRAMGGVGIAKGFGAESGLANPAMINSVESMEISVAATFFMPTVNFNSNAGANAFAFDPNTGAWLGSQTVGSQQSKNDFSVIPEIHYGHKINESMAYGVTIAGTAGMGVDYTGLAGTSNDNGAFNMETNLQLLKVAVPLAYSVAGFTIGVEPVLQYGTLQMNYLKGNPNATGPQDAFIPSDNPQSSSTGFGYEVGLAYAVSGLTIGAVYKSEIEMEYADNIGVATKDFGFSPDANRVPQGIASGDFLNQPAEIGFGLAYTMKGNTIAFDYKNIQWGEAKGYKDFGWENQNVYSLGYEYARKSWALRLGYNYAKSPIVEQNAKASAPTPEAGQLAYENGAKNFFNLAGFPGVVEQHLTLGGGYQFNDLVGLDASMIYAPEVSNSFDTTGMTQGLAQQGGVPPAGAGQITTSTADVTHSQLGFTVALNFKF